MSDTEGTSHKPTDNTEMPSADVTEEEGSREGGGYVPHKVEIPHGGDENEARRAMEEARRRKEQQAAEAIAEYEEARRAEKLKEASDIEDLRQKREQRRQGRVDDEKRLQEQRQQEDARRKAEEEERKRKKQEEEDKRKIVREQKRQEAMKRMGPKKPNYVITKKEDGEEVEEEEEPKKEVKSKEQLEQEKRAILAQRIHPLELDNLDSAKLQEKAKSLHEHIRNLVSQQYDLQQTFQRLQYDMIEMAERARQMAKSRRALASAQVDESFDRLADKYTGAPPKIQVKSKYERDLDQQTFADKLRAFKQAADAERGPPVIPDNGPDYSLMYI